MESYNQRFSLMELQDALRLTYDTAVGPDEIYYQLLKHPLEVYVCSLLQIFNSIWQTGCFPSDWSEAIVILLPKSDKDHTYPENYYRPVALTSYLCKTFERMVNNRFTWYLKPTTFSLSYRVDLHHRPTGKTKELHERSICSW